MSVAVQSIMTHYLIKCISSRVGFLEVTFGLNVARLDISLLTCLLFLVVHHYSKGNVKNAC